MRWGCQRNNQRSPKILLFVISLLRLLPSGVPLCMGRSAGKSSVPFQSQIPCSPCPGLTALAGVSCGIGGQPVLEVGVVGADEDGGVFLVKIDFGGFFLLGRPCSHRLILSAALSRNRGVFQVFSSALDLGKMAIFKQERAGRCLPCPTRSHSIKCVFSGSTQESASFVPRDRFFSVRMEESPQIITLNHILIAADFPAQLRTFPRSSVFSRSNSAARSFLWTDLGHSSFTSQVSLGKALLLQFNSSWIAKLAKR